MRTLLMTGTAIAALFAGLASVSAQNSDNQLRPPGARQERQDSGSPGRSESAPGQNRPAADDASRPGRSESAPGQNRPVADDANRPGRSESAPGQNRAQGGDDDAQRRRLNQAGGDTDQKRRADDPNQRDRDNNKSADDNQLRQRDPNRQADDQNQPDRKNRQADDQNQPDRKNRQADDQNQPDRKNRQADDQNQPDRKNRQADDQNQRDRDNNRQAGKDRDGGDAKLSIKLKGEEKTKITASLVQRAKPVDRTKIKFNINVGTTVPRGDIELYTVPETIVSIVPQYRGYRYFVVEDEIIIVEPTSYRIVEVIDRSGGGSTGAARLTIDRSKFGLLKRELKSKSDIKVKITTRQGEVLPDDVELWDIPQSVVTEVPELRTYRYVVYQDEVVVVDPDSRRIVEVIE
jgi:hypothetical protein